jgi:hypothetical protein
LCGQQGLLSAPVRGVQLWSRSSDTQQMRAIHEQVVRRARTSRGTLSVGGTPRRAGAQLKQPVAVPAGLQWRRTLVGGASAVEPSRRRATAELGPSWSLPNPCSLAPYDRDVGERRRIGRCAPRLWISLSSSVDDQLETRVVMVTRNLIPHDSGSGRQARRQLNAAAVISMATETGSRTGVPSGLRT